MLSVVTPRRAASRILGVYVRGPSFIAANRLQETSVTPKLHNGWPKIISFAEGATVSTKIRSKSTSASASGCPVHQVGNEGAEEPPLSSKKGVPKLVEVPKLPFVGSNIYSHSGYIAIDLNNPYKQWVPNYTKFGGFYSVGLPGFGKGIYGDIYILTDPNEMLNAVVRNESLYPFGAIEVEWPLIEFLKERDSPLAGFFGRGAPWQKLRRFMQTDLLSPAAAKGYVKGMVSAAQHASRGAPAWESDLNTYMARTSFDLFSTIMFGEMTGVANPIDSEPDPLNVEFCETSVTALEQLFPLFFRPWIILMLKVGIKPELYRTMETNFERSREIAFAKVDSFREKKEAGNLTENEEASYYSRALDRQAKNNEDMKSETITDEEVKEIGAIALTAALDTTSAVLNWTLIHLALNPNVQERLREELLSNLQQHADDGMLNEACLNKTAAPYLHAVVRENQRMTPPVPVNLQKDNPQTEIEIHGTKIPKDSMIVLDTYSIGMHPDFVPDFKTFRPERWLEEEVKARVGTPAEVLDHPLYKEPFSAGARKCPGSRVASYEVLVVISQLLLDWKISVADEAVKSLDDIRMVQGLTIQPQAPKMKFEPRSK